MSAQFVVNTTKYMVLEQFHRVSPIKFYVSQMQCDSPPQVLNLQTRTRSEQRPTSTLHLIREYTAHFIPRDTLPRSPYNSKAYLIFPNHLIFISICIQISNPHVSPPSLRRVGPGIMPWHTRNIASQHVEMWWWRPGLQIGR